MAKQIIEARVKQKVDTERNWLNNELRLLDGEQAFVRTDAGVSVNFKIGDGNKTFSELPYFYPPLTLGSISTNQTLLQLNALADGVWVAREPGTFAFGLTANEGYFTTFRKVGNQWTLNSRTEVLFTDPNINWIEDQLENHEQRITSNETSIRDHGRYIAGVTEDVRALRYYAQNLTEKDIKMAGSYPELDNPTAQSSFNRRIFNMVQNGLDNQSNFRTNTTNNVTTDFKIVASNWEMKQTNLGLAVTSRGNEMTYENGFSWLSQDDERAYIAKDRIGGNTVGVDWSIRKVTGTTLPSNYILPANAQTRTLPISVNGNYADANGNIVVSGGSGGSYILPPATASTLGGVKIGFGLTTSEDGTVSVSGGGASYIAGAGISIDRNEISAKVDGTTITTNASGQLVAIGGGDVNPTANTLAKRDTRGRLSVTDGTEEYHAVTVGQLGRLKRRYTIIEDMYRSPAEYVTNKIFDLAHDFTLIHSVFVDGIRLVPVQWSYNYETRKLNVISLGYHYNERQNISISVIGEVETEDPLDIIDKKKITELVYRVEANDTIILPVKDSDLHFMSIDWGDGTVNNEVSHTYTTAGTKSVKITGRIITWGAGNLASKDKLYEILSWGNLMITRYSMFDGYSNLNLENVTDIPYVRHYGLAYMFRDCKELTSINRLTEWDISGLVSLAYTWQRASKFNQDLNGLDVSSVDSFYATFSNAVLFNGNISQWNMISALSLTNMLYNCSVFNQDISNWNVSKVRRFDNMLYGCASFNQLIGKWNVESAENMNGMLRGTTVFSQDISYWNVSKVNDFVSFLYQNSAFGTANLNALYTKWSQLDLKPNLSISFGTNKYSSAGLAGRTKIRTDFNWTITDGGQQ